MAFIGASKDIPGIDDLKDVGQVITDRRHDNGWINARDCGASGSKFETRAVTKSGSRQIMVVDVGDFKVGQGIMVSKSNIQYTPVRMWEAAIPYYKGRPSENSVEVRGYDGSTGSWVIYILDIAPSATPAFRWSEDLGITWHTEIAITHDWQPLSGGVEVKFNRRNWGSGYLVAFGARDQLISRIEKIEGNVLTLEDEVKRTVNDATIRHNDTIALQEAINKGVREKLNVFVPAGHYMLAKTIKVTDPKAITIEGATSEDTILDISEGDGACFTLSEGTEVIIRNFRMIGFMGFDERAKAGAIRNRDGNTTIWLFALKHCNALTIQNTERVLIENCHASRMSGECFEAAGRSRGTAKPGQTYSQWITYLRCSVTDSARNAFNDVMCGIENTSILNCRIVDVGAHSWEGASRFVKFIGNYVNNAGPVGIGNLAYGNRDKTYPDLGAGQILVADNVFEGDVPYGSGAVFSSRGATQVIIRNNLFINYNSAGIVVNGSNYTNEYSSSNTIITGNIFDMTCVGKKPVQRAAINIACNHTIISDNQIYVRGTADPLVTAIRLREPALNVIVHDNLIRNCGTGIISEKGESRVGDVIDDRTFLRSIGPAGLPIDLIDPEIVKGWSLIWKSSDPLKPDNGISVIESFDPGTLRFKLREPRQMKTGDRFEVIIPSVNWTLHSNTITDCLRPVVLDSYGSKTSLFRNNLVIRGTTGKVMAGMEIHGLFQLLDNRIMDFDENKAIAISLYPDALGKPCNSQILGNIIENCNIAVNESQPGLWKKCMAKDNQTIGCIEKIPKH